MTNTELKEYMMKLDEKIDEGFNSVNREISDVKQRLSILETTVKNHKTFVLWLVGLILSIGGIVVAIIYK